MTITLSAANPSFLLQISQNYRMAWSKLSLFRFCLILKLPFYDQSDLLRLEFLFVLVQVLIKTSPEFPRFSIQDPCVKLFKATSNIIKLEICLMLDYQ